MIAALTVVIAGAVFGRSQAEPYRPPRVDVESSRPYFAELPQIPDRLPDPQPQDKLEAKLAAFARHVEEVRANVEPPLVAFNAEALRGEIEETIAWVDDRAQVSVHIRDLDSGRVLFDYYGDTLLNPASNQKLLTVAAALDLLGSDYVFETRVLQVGSSLILVGEGDPTIDGEALAALAGEVADRIAVAEINEIVVDDSAFSPQVFGPGYSKDGWGPSYEAPSGALSLNFNTVELTVYPVPGSKRPVVQIEPESSHVRVSNQSRYGATTELEVRSIRVGEDEDERGALTEVQIFGTMSKSSSGQAFRRRVVDPGMFTAGAFATMLASASHSEGVQLRVGVAPLVDLGDGEVSGDGDHQELPRIVGHDGEHDVLLVAVRRSPPLIEVANGLLTYSNNFTAEQILRTLGWRMTGDPGDWDNGSEVLRGYWEALGNDPEQLVFENGSGLSSVGRVTTTGLVDLMAVAARTHPEGTRLLDVLPIAGAEGTLRARLRRSAKRVRAKSGTLAGVSGLTGVITSEDGEPQVVFSILINVREADRIGADARREIEDRIVMDVLDYIDGWEAVRGTLILDLEPIAVRPGEESGATAPAQTGAVPDEALASEAG